jgi:hypothetical protein
MDQREARGDWLDRLEASDAVRRYFLAMDEFDWATASQYVAARIRLDAGGLADPPEEVSREEYIEALIARNGGYEVSLHINADHVVDLDGDGARVRTHFFGAHSVGPGSDDGYVAYGLYDLRLVKEDGRWKITRLTINLMKVHGANPATIAARAVARLSAESD